MAKKQKTNVEVKEPQTYEEVAVKAPPVVKQQKKETPVIDVPESDAWEPKSRTYLLKGNKKPLSKMIRSANIYWFDEEKKYEREIKYCENQRTPFVDEMQGEQRLSHIIFRNGVLHVPREKTVLQKFLSLYHPHKNKIYYEHKPQLIAQDELADINLEVDALIAARNMDIGMAEAVMRAEIGSKVSTMSSKELKRDLLVFAKKNPKLLLALAGDEDVQLRNFGIKATEIGVLKLSQDQRTFTWGSNNRKLMNVPFDEHPYSALAQWFKTDEGLSLIHI